jgi:hypothetical protein
MSILGIILMYPRCVGKQVALLRLIVLIANIDMWAPMPAQILFHLVVPKSSKNPVFLCGRIGF